MERFAVHGVVEGCVVRGEGEQLVGAGKCAKRGRKDRCKQRVTGCQWVRRGWQVCKEAYRSRRALVCIDGPRAAATSIPNHYYSRHPEEQAGSALTAGITGKAAAPPDTCKARFYVTANTRKCTSRPLSFSSLRSSSKYRLY